jgi:hypothetical protein
MRLGNGSLLLLFLFSGIVLGIASGCGESATRGPDDVAKGPPSMTPPADAGNADAGNVSTGGPTSPAPAAGVVTHALDTPPSTVLPSLPALTNVVAVSREDSVGIDFDPVEGGADYRVYPLPKDSDVTINADHSLTIAHAIYRCAGLRQTFDLPNGVSNPLGVVPDGGQTYENANQQFSWGAQIPANPTVGYVNVVPGTGLVPVYAVGIHPAGSEVGWQESRPKIYTTDSALRQTLLSAGGRDDGIVFYVPSAASASTTTIYHSETAASVGSTFPTEYAEYYFTSADMAAHASDTTPPAPAFQVWAVSAPGTQPLMAVFYKPGQNHTELAVGEERFKRAANQGPGPLWHVEWSGITAPTTLVVEALASGCPFQGSLSPQSLSAPPHQPLLTAEQMQQASATGELYLNGQYDLPGTSFPILVGNGAMGGMWAVSDAGAPLLQIPNSSPVPIARSFVQVAPVPHDPTWDWYQGFSVGTALPPLAPASDTLCACSPTGPSPCVSGAGGCGYFTSSVLDLGVYLLDVQNNVPVFTYGQYSGQLFDVLDDAVQDVAATLRMTAPQTAAVGANQFLHVTWSVDVVSTHRRYPQLLVTDHGPPEQDALTNPNGNTLIIQTFAGTTTEPRFEAEAFHGLVNGRPWQVNNQAPEHSFIDTDTWNANDPLTATMQPTVSIFEHAGMDRMTKFDAYISSSLVYTFVDGTPAGCMQYPAGVGFALSGPVSVTFGDVLYHESAPDEGICNQSHPYAFMHEHQCEETKRHWDDLGFKSGVAVPEWDYGRFPCKPY